MPDPTPSSPGVPPPKGGPPAFGLWLSDSPVTVNVVGDSMDPFLKEGDRVEVVKASPASFRPGDLIVFPCGEQLVIHRFLAALPGGFLEKGDNRGWGAVYPWPEALGRGVALLRSGERIRLDTNGASAEARVLARRSLWRHRGEGLARRAPGKLLPRLLRGLFRRLY